MLHLSRPPPQIEGVLGGARTSMPDLPTPAWPGAGGWRQPLGLIGGGCVPCWLGLSLFLGGVCFSGSLFLAF